MSEIIGSGLMEVFTMLRAVSFFLLFGPLVSLAQTSTAVSHRGPDRQITCGPVAVAARMLDTSKDGPLPAHQKVGIALRDLNSAPILLERITLHFSNETATSRAPFTWETRQKIDAKQEILLAELTTV
jgi:hypothetical protein